MSSPPRSRAAIWSSFPRAFPASPALGRDDLFSIKREASSRTSAAVAANFPGALMNIISNPVNSTVPIAAEVFKKAGTYDPKKVFGVTTLDVVRSNTFVAEARGLDVNDVDVPVVDGHAGICILPLLLSGLPLGELQRG